MVTDRHQAAGAAGSDKRAAMLTGGACDGSGLRRPRHAGAGAGRELAGGRRLSRSTRQGRPRFLSTAATRFSRSKAPRADRRAIWGPVGVRSRRRDGKGSDTSAYRLSRPGESRFRRPRAGGGRRYRRTLKPIYRRQEAAGLTVPALGVRRSRRRRGLPLPVGARGGVNGRAQATACMRAGRRRHRCIWVRGHGGGWRHGPGGVGGGRGKQLGARVAIPALSRDWSAQTAFDISI